MDDFFSKRGSQEEEKSQNDFRSCKALGIPDLNRGGGRRGGGA